MASKFWRSIKRFGCLRTHCYLFPPRFAALIPLFQGGCKKTWGMKKVDNLEEESLQWELSMEEVGRRRWNRRLAAVLGTHGLRSREGLVGRRTVARVNSRDLGLQLSLQLGLSLDEREKSGEGVAVKVGGLLLALRRGVEKREPRAE